MKKNILLAILSLGVFMLIQPPAFTNSHLFNSPDKSGDTLTEVDNYSCYLKVFLEGAFNGTNMNTDIFDNGQLPVNQPYNIPPWNYNGTETLQASPGTDIVDWVYLEFRRTPYGPESATPETTVYRRAGLLHSDGTVTEVDGTTRIWIYAPPLTNMYVVVYHRNHLALLSNTPLIPWAPAGVGYDFSDDLSKAYLDGQKELTPGIFGMIGGDCDANGIIELNDKEVCWTPEAGHTSYLPGDWNLDLQINNPDKDDIWYVNMGLESKVPRTFVCGELLTDSRDDQTYETVLIGEQCWMAENLNIGARVDAIAAQNNNEIIEKFCYNDIIENCDSLGGLYLWDELMEYNNIPASQGICPKGWHVPTDNEWCTLSKYVDATVNCEFGTNGTNVGYKLKSTTGWYFEEGNGSDEFGFTALPAGFWGQSYNYDGLELDGIFWTSSEFTEYQSWYWYLYVEGNDIYHLYWNKSLYGLSVRCLKNYNNEPPLPPSDPFPEFGDIEIDRNISLLWSYIDPEDDPLTFDIYFGIESDPPLVAEGLSDFTYEIDNLDCNTEYFWRTVAHDDHQNITEGPIWSFTTIAWECGCSIFDSRDGQTYNTTQIGEQCWMAENLNIGSFLPGALLQTNNSEIEKYCYNNDPNNCITYGGLYQWNEMMQYSVFPPFQGICPTGWHIGTMNEWQILTTYLGGTAVAGGKMKEADYLHWLSPNTGATNESGFTALPGGNRFYGTGTFMDLQTDCYFWTSENQSSNFAFLLNLSHINPIVTYSYNYKNYGYSVRCVKD